MISQNGFDRFLQAFCGIELWKSRGNCVAALQRLKNVFHPDNWKAKKTLAMAYAGSSDRPPTAEETICVALDKAIAQTMERSFGNQRKPTEPQPMIQVRLASVDGV